MNRKLFNKQVYEKLSMQASIYSINVMFIQPTSPNSKKLPKVPLSLNSKKLPKVPLDVEYGM